LVGSVEPFARAILSMKLTALASGVAVPSPNLVVPALALFRKLMLFAKSLSVAGA